MLLGVILAFTTVVAALCLGGFIASIDPHMQVRAATPRR